VRTKRAKSDAEDSAEGTDKEKGSIHAAIIPAGAAKPRDDGFFQSAGLSVSMADTADHC
jgi:hypothetical protein